MFLGPMRGCWSLQTCLTSPICYSAEQTSASADAGCTSERQRNQREQGHLRKASQGESRSQQGSGLVQCLPTWPSFMLT